MSEIRIEGLNMQFAPDGANCIKYVQKNLNFKYLSLRQISCKQPLPAHSTREGRNTP
jgi:hypothetical protein